MNSQSSLFPSPGSALRLSFLTVALIAPSLGAQQTTEEAPTAPVREAPRELSFEEELAAFYQPGALTAQQVAERAVQTSARIEAKRSAVASTESTISETKARFYPRLHAQASYTRLSRVNMPAFGTSEGASTVFLPGETATPRPYDPATDQLMVYTPPPYTFPLLLDHFALTATLSIPLSDYVFRLGNAVSGASRQKEAAELQEKAERALVQTDAKLAYYSWVKARGAHYVAQKSVEQIRLALQDVRQSMSIGTASQADVLRTESQLKNFELLVVRAERNVQVATEHLRTFLREEEVKEYFVGEQVLTDISVPPYGSLEESYQEARSQRAELQALQAIEKSHLDHAGILRSELYPRLDAQASATYANPNQRIFPQTQEWKGSWDASIVLSWTPTDIPAALNAIDSAKAKAAEFASQRRAMEDGLRMEIAQAIGELENALASVDASREILKSAEESYRVRRELFRAGRATSLEVTDAQTQLTQARLDLVFSHVDSRIAREKLLYALGRQQDTQASTTRPGAPTQSSRTPAQ